MSASAQIGALGQRIEAATGEAAQVLHALFGRELEVPITVARRVLGRQAIDELAVASLATSSSTNLVGRVRISRFHDVLVASDRLGFRRHPDAVMGPGPSSALVASAVRPIDRGRVLDLGCGPGTQALWLAGPRVEALGLDMNPRALAFAAFNRDLNRRHGATFEAGDFLTASADPALDEAFDVAVANPPFVLAPATEIRYRDRPLPGHDTTRVTVERVARALAPGGRGYVVGTWFDDGRAPWDAIPRSWLRTTGCRAALALVASQSAAEHAAFWTRDTPPLELADTLARWTAALDAEGAVRIHVGLVALARPERRTWLRRAGVTVLSGPRHAWRSIEQALAA